MFYGSACDLCTCLMKIFVDCVLVLIKYLWTVHLFNEINVDCAHNVL